MFGVALIGVLLDILSLTCSVIMLSVFVVASNVGECQPVSYAGCTIKIIWANCDISPMFVCILVKFL